VRTSPARLERLFAQIAAATVPACAVAGVIACGAASTTSESSPDGGPHANDDDAHASDDAQLAVVDATSPGDGHATPDEDGGGCVGPVSCCPFLATLDAGLPDANEFADAGIIGGFNPAPLADGGPTHIECIALCSGYVYGCTVQSAGPPAVVSCVPQC
jgi:hypothetical protein